MAAKISMAISKAIKIPLPQQLYAYRLITSACFSTAYERTEGSNAEKEARGGGGGTSGLSFTPKETVKEQGLHEAKQQGLDMTNDPARDGPVMADTVGDTAKAAADGQWKAALETTQKIKDDDETKGSNRNTSSDEEDPNIKDLRRRAGGYDKRDHY